MTCNWVKLFALFTALFAAQTALKVFLKKMEAIIYKSRSGTLLVENFG